MHAIATRRGMASGGMGTGGQASAAAGVASGTPSKELFNERRAARHGGRQKWRRMWIKRQYCAGAHLSRISKKSKKTRRHKTVAIFGCRSGDVTDVPSRMAWQD